jgi:hypothetical protein
VAYNLWLILGFVLGGVAVTYLSLEFGSGWPGAFVAGFVYTFSEYHFAHAAGHFQLIAVEWLPSFFLMWMRLLARPSAVRGLVAAGTFLLVFFADYYYALFSVLAGAGALLFLGINRRERRLWLGLGVFVAIVAAVAGPVALATEEFLRPGLTASHNPGEFGADLLAPFVPGASWKFAELTKPVWSTFKVPAIEGAGYLGWAAIVLAAIAVANRREWFLVSMGVFFLALSFGPDMRIGGQYVRGIWGPYHHFARIFPVIEFGGVPGRMGVMAVLAVALLAGLGVEALRKSGRTRVLASLLVLGFVESLPAGLPNTPMPEPQIFRRMRELPRGYGVLDLSSTVQGAWQRYYQTKFELPTMSGLNSRLPQAVVDGAARVAERARHGELEGLCRGARFRYLMLADVDAVPGELAGRRPVLEGDGLRVFDLGELWDCRK